ncbi:MAG: hypothetical protein BZY88_14970 [SAR202 cluster bacterium Io17-Chloro-G9]|nr:MAG: hypothetical protein BZY88_14970 [SAR202 cluster bacterium Io17-Chloro-G9]
MSVIVPGILTITVFLLASGLMFGTFLTASATQGESLKDLTVTNTSRVGNSLNITSAAVDTAGSGDLTVAVNNTGSQSTAVFSRMDVILEYTDTSDNAVVTYLEYSSAALGNNQWTVRSDGISPDTFNPKMWDSDEVMTIDILVAPAVKAGTAALVAVATPWGGSVTPKRLSIPKQDRKHGWRQGQRATPIVILKISL